MPTSSRSAIGLLTSSTVEPWAVRQWEGIVEAARDLNLELVSYIGGVLRSAQFEGQAGVMYDLAAAGRLDGLIIWTTALGWMLPHREIVEFLDRFGATPKVSMEMSFPGIPSVVMDDYSGMRAVVDHLIEDHGRRRIAFLRGPSTHEGFERRFRAYRDSLEEHGLPVEAGLISPPFARIDGAVSMRALLGEGRPGMDAVVGADDLFAISALTVLAGRGVRVPQDVAVAGFDNMTEDLAASPPITSADAPFAAMGRRAMEILADLMAGRSAPEIEIVPVGLVRRRSCGCQSSDESDEGRSASRIGQHRARAAAMPPEGSFDAEEGWRTVAEALREAAPDPDEATVRALWEKFAEEARGGEQGSFIETFVRELGKAAETGADPTRWLRILVAIQRATSPWTTALPYEARVRAGELWGRAQELLAEAIQRDIAGRQVSFSARYAIIRALSERLGGIHDLEEQMQIVSMNLSQVGIAGCYVSLFARPDEPTGEARLILAFGGGNRLALPSEGISFPAPQLVPSSFAVATPGLSRLALALYFGDVNFGFVVFEIESKEDGLLCEILRWQLSGILKNAADFRAHRAAAAEKETMLRELQHRIKNSIGIIASLVRIESMGASHPEAREVLAALEARIAAVGDLYEELFDSGGVESVDLSDYLARVVDTVAKSIGDDSNRIAFEVELESCRMDLKRAVSLGLIVNELATDSLKHAFPDGRSGTIGLALRRVGESILLETWDDGMGYPSGFDPSKAEGFGLQLVVLLAEQLGGKLEFEPGGRGARTSLRIDPSA